MIYQVKISETLEKVIEVEASCRNEAISIAKIGYYNQDHILSADDFNGETRFTLPRDRQYER